MSENTFPFQPGVFLHDAIVGAFRASGASFEQWCSEQGITPTVVRSATYGMSKGPRGRQILNDLIAAAGHEVVKAGYLARVESHNKALEKAQAATA